MKRGLVVSGGGAKGAFALGVVTTIAYESWRRDHPGVVTPLGDDRLPWDVMVGSSTGALLAAGLSGGTFQDLANTQSAYLSINGSKDIIAGPGFGLLGKALAFLKKPGIFDPKPLAERIEAYFDPTRAKVQIRVSYVDQVTGELRYAGEKNRDVKQAVLASACMPGYFQPVAGRFVDGGVREIAPLRPAIDLGCDEIDVVLCSPPWPKSVPAAVLKSAKDHAIRALELHSNEVIRGDLKVAMQKNDLPGYRPVVIRVYFPPWDPIGTLDFTPDSMEKAFLLGRDFGTKPHTVEQALAWRP